MAIDSQATFDAKENIWKEEWHPIRDLSGEVPLEISKQFELTKHRIYVTLDLPGTLWSIPRIPEIGKGLPVALPMWAKALEFAWRWARGGTNPEEAAQLIADCFLLIIQSPGRLSMEGKTPRMIF